MPQIKKKAVFTAEVGQLEQIQAVVLSGRYRSSSEFFREAIDEKLERLRRQQLAAQVARYCERGYGDEDAELAAAQTIDGDQ